jgi:hypothetical protein
MTTVLAMVFVLAAVLVAKVLHDDREPLYHAAPLSYWVTNLNKPATADDAITAILAIGTNAIPDLVRTLRRADWSRRAGVVSWLSSHPKLKSLFKFGFPVEPAQRGAYKALLLTSMDLDSTNATMPILIPPLDQKELEFMRMQFRLGAVLKPPRAAIAPLCEPLDEFYAPSRMLIVALLSAVRPAPSKVVAALLAALGNPDAEVREPAWKWLLLQTNAFAIPYLNEALYDSDPAVLCDAAARLGAFGADASGSINRLRQLCTDPMVTIRLAATNALCGIAGQHPPPCQPRPGADISFNYREISLRPLLEDYQEWSGKEVPMVPLEDLANTVRLSTPYPLTRDEAAQLIEQAVTREGLLKFHHAQDDSISLTFDPMTIAPLARLNQLPPFDRSSIGWFPVCKRGGIPGPLAIP